MVSSQIHRLPSNVIPLEYTLALSPDLNAFTFHGEEEIQIQIHEPTPRITLNAADLHIFHANVKYKDGTVSEATRIVLHEEAETVEFIFDRAIPTGSVILSIRFSGVLNDQLRGFYRCLYASSDGTQHALATTQFESTDARRAFPCWDEPALKAAFQIILTIPSNLVAISNTPIEEESLMADGTKTVRFAKTPRMSTYLLAFIVGDMVSIEERSSSGTLVRVWAIPGREEHGRFALNSAIRLLEFFNNYFGIRYPLEKLDHIAVPDFAAGAMENWGCITYRETALLYDPENSDANTQQFIVEVVAHEMAHMWFGDLVTMEWWDDLWLNESFASWMGTKAVDRLYPEWDMWTQFVSQDTNSGLSLDGLKTSHPIAVKVTNPAEIGEIFDAISYSKGSSILRMLEEYLGEEIFRLGLSSYLSEHRFGNAQTKDLWAALEKVSGKPVSSLMNTWVRQPGYPVIYATVERDERTPTVMLSQHRFLYDHLLTNSTPEDTTWQIPVSISGKAGWSATPFLMDEKTAIVPLPKFASTSNHDWIKVNAGQTGFFRVSYSQTEWDGLRGAVESLELPPSDRLGLQNDAFALTRAGILPATLFLSLVEGYINENHASVWIDLSANLRAFEGLILEEGYLSQFHSFTRKLFQRIGQQVGWSTHSDESHLSLILRSTVLGHLGYYGDPPTLKEATGRFKTFLMEPSSLHPNLRGVVFGLAAQEGDQTTYEALLKLKRQTDLHEERVRILRALARFSQEDLLQKTLELSLQPEVLTQDTVMLVAAVASNRRGRELAWQFTKDNWDEFSRRYSGGGFAMMRLANITGGFTSLNKVEEIEDFFNQHPTPAASRTIQQSIERIRLNTAWLHRNRNNLEDWLVSRS